MHPHCFEKPATCSINDLKQKIMIQCLAGQLQSGLVGNNRRFSILQACTMKPASLRHHISLDCKMVDHGSTYNGLLQNHAGRPTALNERDSKFRTTKVKKRTHLVSFWRNILRQKGAIFSCPLLVGNSRMNDASCSCCQSCWSLCRSSFSATTPRT